MNSQKANIVAIVVFVLFIVLNLDLKRKDNVTKNFITDNYHITIGYMISYSISGDADNRILTYEYVVKGNKYQRYITPSIYFDECHNNINLCKYHKFHVIYSAKEPDKSLIDLSYQIIRIDSTYVYKNLDKFE